MPADGSEQMHAALTSLRIDRGDPAPIERARRGLVRWIAAVAILCSAGAAWAVWTATRPAVVSVRIGYASRTGGDAASGPVLSGSGYVVTGDRYISLGARVPGRVARYLVEEGDRVEVEQPLVELDDRHYVSALREAEASQRVAEANARLRRTEIARLHQLHAEHVVSQAALDLKENELLVADSEVDRMTARIAQLQLDLEETIVRSPTGGIVLEKLKEVGEMAVPGGFSGSGDLIRVANLDELRAEVDVNEGDLAKVELGQPSEIVPDAFPSRRYAAEVAKLYPQINRQKGTLRVEVRIVSPDEALRPDMSVRVHFLSAIVAEKEEIAVRIPREAVRGEASSHYVWMVVDGRVARRDVEVAPESGGDLVAVRAGLEGGEALVMGDVAGLDEAAKVETVN